MSFEMNNPSMLGGTMKAAHAKWLLNLLFLGLAMNAWAAGASEQAVTLETPTGKIEGTLMLPSSGNKVPVALIIAGSGPTDRDGNTTIPAGRRDSYKMLAQALADAGIASVRYDKRGVAASLPALRAESELRFDTFVDDATAWTSKLKGDARFSSVTVIGHSEGSLIGMLAAQRANADAFISIAGAAQTVGAIIRKQFAGKLPPALAAENERILALLEHGELAREVPPALSAFYRPSVQPYMISWMRYVPAERIATLKIPSLVVQGDTDIQVSVEEARALKAAKPDAVLVVLPGMNHVLKLVPADMQQQLASYNNPALPLAPQLSKTVIDFMHSAHVAP
jgi:pimeloyl-ACP methyl ester carboxylesterase